MTQRKILSLDSRVQLVISHTEDAMTKLAQIGRSQTRVPLTPVAIEKRQREAREELRRQIELVIRGRGRDMLQLVRQYATEAADTFGEHEDAVSAVPLEGLLAVIDSGFIAEDEPVAGERCPLCERGMTEHTRIDLYGTDAFLCHGATRAGVIVNIAHPQALARLHDAATREAQRQFDELTKGSKARHDQEDYAAILDVLGAVPAEQLEGIPWDEETTAFAPVVKELLARGPLLDREKLENVLRDGIAAFMKQIEVAFGTEEATQLAESLVRLLAGIFPVRVEYPSEDEASHIVMHVGEGVYRCDRAYCEIDHTAEHATPVAEGVTEQ